MPSSTFPRSPRGLGGPGHYVDYAATKGAIDALTLGLAKEVAGDGIRVNAVRPGVIDTDIHTGIGDTPDRVERLGKTTPAGRHGTADEVAEAILWLCSDAASYVTMSLMEVSGGRYDIRLRFRAIPVSFRRDAVGRARHRRRSSNLRCHPVLPRRLACLTGFQRTLRAMKARPCRTTKMSLHHDLLILCARIDFDP